MTSLPRSVLLHSKSVIVTRFVTAVIAPTLNDADLFSFKCEITGVVDVRLHQLFALIKLVHI